MLDGLLKSKFQTKCKSLLKMTKTRLEVIKKKKCSVVKFLKNDMADLLRSGLDYNAYCRAEGLLVEQKMVDCYNFIEQFCACISNNITAMTKQRECPEECKEAVQSLIYAAARIAEFPELRDLRTLYTDRYGNSLESFINQEFVEKLNKSPATKEMKLQLLHDIAAEFNIEWNSKSLEQKIFKPSSAPEDQYRYESLSNAGDEAGYKSKLAYQGRKVVIDEKYNQPSSSDDEVISGGRRDSTDLDSVHARSSSVGSVSDDEVDRKRQFYNRFAPPPYFRPKIALEEETSRLEDLGNDAKVKPKSVRRRPAKSPQENTGDVERPLKPPPGREQFLGNGGGGWFGKMNSRLGSKFRQAEDGDEDEEEKMLDGLLMHYCKDKAVPLKQRNDADDACHRNAKSDELPLPPGREAEEVTPKKKATATRHARAVSFQPDTMRGHVHPKLPDCDDLAARIAALRGR